MMNGIERGVSYSSRFQEVREALVLRKRLLARIAELEQADRDAVMQLTLIRSLLSEYRDMLAHAAGPPTPSIEELS